MCVSFCPQGEHVWLPGGMHGCQGACVVARGHAWLPGACMVARGMRGCGGCVWLLGGVCGYGSVYGWGHVWLWGACVVAGGCIGYDEIWSMSGRYASYWNAFLLNIKLLFVFFMLTHFRAC